MLLLFILHTIYLRAFIIMRQFFIIIAFLGTQLAEAQNKYMTIPQFSSDNAYYKEIACTFLVKDSKGNLARECRELYAFSTTNDTTIAGRSYMVYQEPVFTPEKNIIYGIGIVESDYISPMNSDSLFYANFIHSRKINWIFTKSISI